MSAFDNRCVANRWNTIHNKFLVVDGAAVFTGSANFTNAAFNPRIQYFNYENIAIVYSHDFAQKHVSFFNAIKQKAFNQYVEMVAQIGYDQLPEWARIVLPQLYRKDIRLQETLKEQWSIWNPLGQARLRILFNVQQSPIKVTLPASQIQESLKRDRTDNQQRPPTQN